MRRSRILFVSGLVLVFLAATPLYVAPVAPLWILSLLIERVGPWGVLLCAGMLGAMRRHFASEWRSAVLLSAALILFAIPSIGAWQVGRRLPRACDAAFGSVEEKESPFRLWRLFRGVPRASVDVTEGVYWNQGDQIRYFNLVRPHNSPGVLPLIVMIHGGSWGGGNKGELMGVDRVIASLGYAVAKVNYRLAPQWPYPAAEEDIFHALDYFKAHAKELKVDPSRIVLIGRSAGGQLALDVAYAEQNPAICGVISLYGPTDMVLGYERPSRRWVLNSKKALENYLHGSPAENPAGYRLASPVNHVDYRTPPTLLIHGDLDPIVWPIHSLRLSERLYQMDRPYVYLALPNGTHASDVFLGGPSGQLILYAIRRFLRTAFSPDTIHAYG